MKIEKFNELRAKNLIEGLKKRNMNGYYCKSIDEILERVALLLEDAKTVSNGGSMTLKDCGVMDMLKNKSDIEFIDRETAKNDEEKFELFRKGLMADAYFMSTNAITEDGIMVNVDGTGNRVAALIFGPKKVIIVTGLNKVCANLDDAMLRARTYASPLNSIRLGRNTPCNANGKCADCFSPESICNQIVITRRSGDPDRIHVIITDEDYGF